MAIAMARKQEKNKFWRELRHKGGCCCFGWAVYAPWACNMNLRALYAFKLAKCPLTCPGNFAGDRTHVLLTHSYYLLRVLPTHSFIIYAYIYIYICCTASTKFSATTTQADYGTGFVLPLPLPLHTTSELKLKAHNTQTQHRGYTCTVISLP